MEYVNSWTLSPNPEPLRCGRADRSLPLCACGNRCWVVWERENGRVLLSHGAPHIGSDEFNRSLLPFFDSYAQASAQQLVRARA